MTTGVSAAFGQAFLNYLYRGVAMPTAPAACWVQFHTADPGAAGTGSPATNTSRYQVAFSAATVVGSNAQVVNSGTVTLPSVPATETYTHWSAWTLQSGGSLIGTGTVAGGAVTAGTSPTIASGAMVAQKGVAA